MFESKLEVERTPGGPTYLVVKNIVNGVTVTSAKISFEVLERELQKYRVEEQKPEKKSWKQWTIKYFL